VLAATKLVNENRKWRVDELLEQRRRIYHDDNNFEFVDPVDKIADLRRLSLELRRDNIFPTCCKPIRPSWYRKFPRTWIDCKYWWEATTSCPSNWIPRRAKFRFFKKRTFLPTSRVAILLFGPNTAPRATLKSACKNHDGGVLPVSKIVCTV